MSLIERQAAIDALGDEPEVWGRDDEYGLGLNKQWHYDVNALKALPSAQPEPSTEIQEILDYLDTTLHPIVSPDNWNVYSELHDMVSKLPSVQPEIIRCEDCRWYKDQSESTACLPCRAIVTPSDFYCGKAERKENR